MIPFLIGAAVAVLALDAATAEQLKTRVDQSPEDVATFIERRAACNHFLGEEPYDRNRAAELAKAVRALRCDRLSRDEQRLRRTYRHQPAVQQLLSDTADLLGW